ncbi:PhzF family phenazine biosynthesis protein, partial [Deinococcus sp.]|uniref:PhzF family phenazine biosynthesis protein n=1 Tax=Deinococcus sp. TaxID=47478 RepID=UPI0025F380CB
MTSFSTAYRVLSPADVLGGKTVTVFPDASGDLQARAGAAGTPLSVFVEQLDGLSAHLRVFTPTRDKGESDSAALAALSWLFGQGQIADVASVWMKGQEVPAQLCGGEWLLLQGDVSMKAVPDEDFSSLGFTPSSVQIAQTQRPNLLLQIGSLAELDALQLDMDAVREVGERTGTTGLVVYTLDAGRADVAFRAFGPLRGFDEDAASSNMFACLVGALSVRRALP